MYIIPILKQYESEYVRDSFSDELQTNINFVINKFINSSFVISRIASDFINSINQDVENKFENDLRTKIGINIFRGNLGLSEFLKLKISENINLIKSIPELYFSKLNSLIYGGISAGERASSIGKKISELSGQTKRRAEFIARDQLSKANASITEKRQKEIGVTKYIWRNMDDARVRGNPSGLYPDSKYSHWNREGVVYSYDNPPPDGNPGQPYGCRCYAEAILPEIK